VNSLAVSMHSPTPSSESTPRRNHGSAFAPIDNRVDHIVALLANQPINEGSHEDPLAMPIKRRLLDRRRISAATHIIFNKKIKSDIGELDGTESNFV
jgi:hypothetical protein